MATEPAEIAKTPAEIYTLASRSEQVIEAGKLLEYALREYSGDYRSGLTDLYNSNRKIFEKDLRDQIRSAFETRKKIRNVAKYGEPQFEEKTAAAEFFVSAAKVLFSKYANIYPEKFLVDAPPVADEEFFDKGFEQSNNVPSPFDDVRTAANERELNETNLVRRAQSEDSPSNDLPLAESLPDDEFEVPEYQLPSPSKLFEPKLKIVQLEKICHRMGRSLKAGISITKAWEGEARSLSGNLGNAFRDVLHDISSGDTLANSVTKHDCFPAMFCEMVRVGEETGRLDRAFLRLADHYRNLVQMRRTFISGITWPAFQLCAAIGVISFFFILLSILEAWMGKESFRAPDIFMLGFGPIGNLFIFWTLLAIFGAGLYIAIKGISAGWFGEAPMRLALRIPLIGNTIKTMSLSRFAWSFGMAIESGMDAQRAIRLGVRSTNSHFYMAHENQIADSVGQGNDFYTSLDRTDAFPEDFLQAVEVGELTGEITESLERLSDDYREQTENSLRRISQISGFLVSMFIAIVIIFFIVLMYMNYIGTLNEAINNPMGAMEQYESGETKKPSSNPVTAAKNKMVNQIMENEDMQNYKKLMEGAAKADRLHGHDFLDALLEPFEEK